MAYPRETRDKLRRYYVFEQSSLEVAAMQCGVAFTTAGRWKRESKENGDDWDKQRAAVLMAGDGIEEIARSALSGFMVQYKFIMDTLNTDTSIQPAEKVKMFTSLADSFNKIVAASQRVLPETSQLATAMEVLQEQAKFIREKFPQHGEAFVEILEPFADELSRMYG